MVVLYHCVCFQVISADLAEKLARMEEFVSQQQDTFYITRCSVHHENTFVESENAVSEGAINTLDFDDFEDEGGSDNFNPGYNLSSTPKGQ